MNKLVDQFGTAYFAAHYASEVKTYLASVSEIDLAGARICRDVMKHIMSAAYGSLQVHDTEDPEREAYFAENRRRRELQKNHPETTPLLVPTCSEDTVPLIKSLDPNKLYCLKEGRAVSNQAFAFLVQAARPEIRLDLGSSVGEILALVYGNLFPNSHRWEEFYVLTGTTFVVARPRPGEYNTFISDNIVVPTAFGAEHLFKLKEWAHCIDRVTKLLDKNLKPRNRSIKDYL